MKSADEVGGNSIRRAALNFSDQTKLSSWQLSKVRLMDISFHIHSMQTCSCFSAINTMGLG